MAVDCVDRRVARVKSVAAARGDSLAPRRLCSFDGGSRDASPLTIALFEAWEARMLDEATTAFALGLSTGSIPIILACATILGLLSQRNGHLSDVNRQIRKEYGEIDDFISANPKSSSIDRKRQRQIILKDQYDVFINRYENTARALRVTVGAISIFILADWFALVSKVLPSAALVAELLSIAGILIFAFGLYWLQQEFAEGSKTLKLNKGGMD